MYARNSHRYTDLIPDFGTAREPTVWGLLLHNILVYMTLAGLLEEGKRSARLHMSIVNTQYRVVIALRAYSAHIRKNLTRTHTRREYGVGGVVVIRSPAYELVTIPQYTLRETGYTIHRVLSFPLSSIASR